MDSSRRFFAASFRILLAICAIHPPLAAGGTEGLSLNGYDTVAYFVVGRPEIGSRDFHQVWDGVRYQFANAEHMARFAQDPDRYLPQFAGFCAAGVGMGKKVVADPTVWKIVDGKLYVFSSVKALEMVERDPGLLNRSQQNWATLK